MDTTEKKMEEVVDPLEEDDDFCDFGVSGVRPLCVCFTLLGGRA
jgi:hypothetical protein